MIYSHPLEMPKSTLIKGFSWIGGRNECSISGVHGDTYPMAWAADGEIYASSGDPNWAVFDGVPRHVKWAEAIENPQLYPHVGGTDVVKLTGFGEAFGIE